MYQGRFETWVHSNIIITLPTEFLICRMPDVGTISCFTFNIQEYDLVATPSRSNCSTWWLIQHWIRGGGGPSYTETHGVEHSRPRIRSNFRKYFCSELWTAPAGVARWQDGKNLVISLFLGKCKLLSSCWAHVKLTLSQLRIVFYFTGASQPGRAGWVTLAQVTWGEAALFGMTMSLSQEYVLQLALSHQLPHCQRQGHLQVWRCHCRSHQHRGLEGGK